MLKTERLGNLEHFLECSSVPGSYWRLTRMPGVEELKSWIAENQDGYLAMYWNNPYGVHAICNGSFSISGYGESDISKNRMDALIRQLQKEPGYENVASKWYYPYPAVDFPVAIFSDGHLPDHGECDDNRYNFQDAAIELFDERIVTDKLLATDQYPLFAHAYMLVISLKGEELISLLPEYTRFSNERRQEMQIRTDVYKQRVVKSAFSHLSGGHIHNIAMMGSALSTSLSGLSVLGKPLVVNQLTNEREDAVEFSFAPGESMETLLDQMVQRGEGATAEKLLLNFVSRVRSLPQLVPFESSYDFRRWFGDVSADKIRTFDETGKENPVMSLPVTDIDMIPQNIIVSDQEAVLIDYEWTFTFTVPVDFVIFRFLYYFLEGKYRMMYKEPVFDELYKKAGFPENVRQNFLIMETHFQEYVQQAAAVLRNEYDMYGKPLIRRWQIQSMLLSSGGHEITVRYPSQHEETISSADVARSQQSPEGSRQEVYHYKIPVTESGEMILMLPPVRLLRIGILSVSGGRSKEQEFLANGDLLAGCVYCFETDQPKLSIDVSQNQTSYLMLSLEEIPASKDAYDEIRTAISDYKFLAENRDKQLEALKSSASWKLTKPLRSLRREKE